MLRKAIMPSVRIRGNMFKMKSLEDRARALAWIEQSPARVFRMNVILQIKNSEGFLLISPIAGLILGERDNFTFTNIILASGQEIRSSPRSKSYLSIILACNRSSRSTKTTATS